MNRPLSHRLLAAVWTFGEGGIVDAPTQGLGVAVVPKPREAQCGVLLSVTGRGAREQPDRSVTVFLDIDEALTLASEIMDALEKSGDIAREKGLGHAA
jgi:hypothetical protein